MSKSRHNKFKDWDDGDDSSYNKAYKDQNRRKQKKLKAALKIKNINEIVSQNDEE